MSEFSERLKKARKKANLTQEQIAMLINVPRSNISKYENGNLEPNIQTLKELIINYKTTANYLLDIIENNDEDKNILDIWHSLTEREKGEFIHLYREICNEKDRKKKENAG